MLFFHALILGILEGITEFLPISSTAHLLLAERVLGTPEAFSRVLSIAIQSGAMFAVLVLTWREWKKPEVLSRVLAGFLPTGVIGFVLYTLVKEHLLRVELVGYTLIAGGIVMYLFERFFPHAKSKMVEEKPSLTEMTHTQAMCVGIAQSLAIVPGVSRSAASILGGLSLGIRRETVVMYSFLLAVPTIGAATTLDLWHERAFLTMNTLLPLALGICVSGVVAFLVMRWLLAYIRTHDFIPFAVYRVVLGIAVLLLI